MASINIAHIDLTKFSDQKVMRTLIAELCFKLVFILGVILQITVMWTLPALKSLDEPELTENWQQRSPYEDEYEHDVDY